jgi:hypothetical protein
MTTLLNKLSMCVLTAFVLPTFLFAQEPAVATSTETIELPVSQDWFVVERLIGTVDNGDFVVGPGRSEINLQPGQSKTVFISVANRISDDRTFRFEVVDVTGSADGASALSLVEGGRGPYSIIDYISFPEETITLKLGDRARVPVTVSLPPDAEPGGYYGSILVSTVQTGREATDIALPSNPIIARVGSHVFLTVGGEQDLSGETIGLSTIPSTSWYTEGPINLGIAYENTGSVHLNPYGEITVTNILGEQVGYVELEPWFVLPKSLRTREVTWDREFLFGRYTVEANINRGYDDVIDTVTTSFWVIPYQFVGAVFGGLFIIFLLIRLFLRTFEFRRK